MNPREVHSRLKRTMIFVLVDPPATFLSFHHQRVIPETRIHEGVDEGTRQVCAGRVHSRRTAYGCDSLKS